MSNVKLAYGTSAQAITCTLASLASAAAAGRESGTIDNRTNLFVDAFVFLQVRTGAGVIGNDQAVYAYAWGTVDDATTLPDAVTGADAAITLNNPTQLRLLGTIWTPAVSTTYKGGPFSVAKAFDGFMPAEWGIVIRNYSGVALDATETNHKKMYQGVYATVA